VKRNMSEDKEIKTDSTIPLQKDGIGILGCYVSTACCMDDPIWL
jgi:hypothetical protein